MNRKIFVNGINYSTAKPLIAPINVESFGKRIQEFLLQNSQEVQRVAQTSLIAKSFREEAERKVLDPGDPRAVGWTFLVSESDPRLSKIVEIIKPLAKWRGMEDPEDFLIFDEGKSEDEWHNWLQNNYMQMPVLEGKNPPYYVLIIGGPDLIPFKFQSLFDTAACVGRVDFDSTQDLQTYVEKIIRLEQLPKPEVMKKAIIFAPDAGPKDATYFTCRYMAAPIADHIKTSLGFKTTVMLGAKATKQNLVSSLHESHPALVYTASQGLGAINDDLQTQKRINGSLLCQRMSGQPFDNAVLFTADDVSSNDDQQAFLEGSVFFQVACYGYGTPAESDFNHWLGNPELNSEADFISALPKKLLAHPRGPIAYIGHVDASWVDGFDDRYNLHRPRKWHSRIAPFVFAINTLLKDVNPVGLAMAMMNDRYNISNATLTSVLDRLKRAKKQITSQFWSEITDAFMFRTDAQNYMVFGDPAVRLRRTP